MATIPKQLPKAINWVRRRVPIWAAAPEAIGLRPEQVDELTDLATQAHAALAEYRRLEAQLQAQGIRYRGLAGRMREMASGQVTQVRGYARTTDNPQKIYGKARLRAPKRRGRAPAPGTPTRFRTRLTDRGGLDITFRCPHPKGVEHVTYKIERQEELDGTMRYLTTVKERRFIDEAIPVGVGELVYRVTAMTSTRDGDATSHLVRLGTVRERARSQRAREHAA
ncbi:hypothetical protein AY599_21440 [Leptolyngbya valderiana BDU 20041]|nr:hypothetical protein AY599_21440 [Leptolyngbya valderiana BDU 20041]